MYREYKALYLELRAADDDGGGWSRGTRDPTCGDAAVSTKPPYRGDLKAAEPP